MKNWFLRGILDTLLVFGFVFMGCTNVNSPNGVEPGEIGKITVTGVSAQNGKYLFVRGSVGTKSFQAMDEEGVQFFEVTGNELVIPVRGRGEFERATGLPSAFAESGIGSVTVMVAEDAAGTSNIILYQTPNVSFSNGTAAVTVGPYNYDLKTRYEETVPAYFVADSTGMGSVAKGYSVDALINSPLGEGIMENLRWYLDYTNQDAHPDLLAYWDSLGIRKEVFNGGEGDEYQRTDIYAIYTPKAALEEGNTKKYPVVFFLHGNINKILLAETYGYAALGAQEGYITVIPYSNNLDTIVVDTAMLLTKLRDESYPIDESRIYAVGFSLGGYGSLQLALAYPNLFAAIGPGGTSPNGFGLINPEDQGWVGLAAHGMPLIHVAGSLDGQLDILGCSPMLSTDTSSPAIAVFNKWLEVNKINITLTSDMVSYALLSPNFVESETGAIFQKVYTEVYDTSYHFGEYSNAKGEPVMKIVVIEELLHLTNKYFAPVVWDFLKHWSRNVDTKEFVYTP
jgi:pimeloyl-ACP methyl ester carboxylesterase